MLRLVALRADSLPVPPVLMNPCPCQIKDLARHPASYNSRFPSKMHPMAGKLHITTHGCQMNVYDSAKMADVLAAEHGLELTDDVALADVVLVNTCSIREKAQEKVFSQLGRWKKLKQARPDVLIGVGGCVASQEGAA